MARTDPKVVADDQSRELLALLADEVVWPVLRELLEHGSAQQAALVSATGIERTQVGRALGRLRGARIIASSRGRNAVHQVVLGRDTVALMVAGDTLADAVNAERVAAQKRSSQCTRRLPKRETST